MYKNDNAGILKNRTADGCGTIFKSNVVDTYLCSTTCASIWLCHTITGLTAGESVSIFNVREVVPTCKITVSSDGIDCQFNFYNYENTYDTKKFYYCGSLEKITTAKVRRQNASGCFQGDMMCYMNQFPNLTNMDWCNTETDFNQNISYGSVPASLRAFGQYDRGIQGDWSTVTNSNCIECWCLCYTPYSGNFCDVNPINLIKHHGYFVPASYVVDMAWLTTGNTNLRDTCYYYLYGGCGDVSKVDPSNLTTCMFWNLLTSYTNFTGDFSGWTFNTGLTGNWLLTSAAYGDITNWNIADTQISSFCLCSTNYYNPPYISGSTSGWTFCNSGLTAFNLSYTQCVTDIPSDWSVYPNLSQLYINVAQCVEGNLNNFLFPDSLNSVTLYCTSLCGSVSCYINDLLSTGATYISLRYNCMSGNTADICLACMPALSQFYMEGSCLAGNFSDLDITSNSSLTILEMDVNPCMYWDLNTPFNTCTLSRLSVNSSSGITGSFTNLTIGSNLNTLCIGGSCIYSDVNELDFDNNIATFDMSNACVAQEVSPLFSGTNNLTNIRISNNPNMSGDTGCWNISNAIYFTSYATGNLYGRLCLTQACCILTYNSCIQSCIGTDIDPSVRGLYICMFSSDLQGHLSAVTFNFSTICRFNVNINSGVTGGNQFTDYVFINRKNFTKNPTCLNITSIGDNITGTSEVLGDLGTYGGDPSGMDLTEAQVNNLAAGTDYDGLGSNTPWDSKNKIYWFKNACCTSATTTKRYVGFCYYYD